MGASEGGRELPAPSVAARSAEQARSGCRSECRSGRGAGARPSAERAQGECRGGREAERGTGAERVSADAPHEESATLKGAWPKPSVVPARVERTDPDGVDYGRVMQLTFVVTIAVGAPLVAVLSIPFDLATWADRVSFAVRVGAVVWIVTALAIFWIERRRVRDDPDEVDS